MSGNKKQIDSVRVSRAGHTFHERWAARRALQLVFPRDNLFSIVVEGLSPDEPIKIGQEAEEIADLVLYYGDGDTFEKCSAQQILQFKYKAADKPVTSSYLKKTLKKFSATLRNFKQNVPYEEIEKKLSFSFVTNAEFSEDLWQAIAGLKADDIPITNGAKRQAQYLADLCEQEEVKAAEVFPLIEFRAGVNDLPTQNRALRKTISDWSGDSTGMAAKRLFALVELVREKAQIEGQGRNCIRREDVLEALECDEDQLFPADTRFVDVGDIVKRSALQDVKGKVEGSSLPIFLHADGGVGKTIFIQSLATHLRDLYEVVIFDCFGGGSYRSEAQARHLPRIGLLQIINELSSRGLCDPLLPTDSDQYGLIEVARKRLKQAGRTVKNQSGMLGVLIVLDASDNAQLEADVRSEPAFPRLLLASLSSEPIEGVKILLTARPHRMERVIGNNEVERIALTPFTEEETQSFLEIRRKSITDLEFSTAFARSRGNARVLEYLVESWDANVSGNAPKKAVTVEELINQKCEEIFKNLHKTGWSDVEVREFFAALSLLPPPIPLTELAEALGWSYSQIRSAASDLAPMLELVRDGAIFRDEPTETYIKKHYAEEVAAQQSIAERLQERQKNSTYAAEALPHFLVVIGDSDRAYELANSEEFPNNIESDYGRRRLRLARLYAAFSLATRDRNLDRVLQLSMQLSQVAAANARGDQFIRRSPALATILGDSSVSRRLFNDRSGWRGARDARLSVAYSFTNESDEARIHQNRAIGWINWYLRKDHEDIRYSEPRLEASDVAAVLFVNVLKNEFSSFNRNIKLWNFRFALTVLEDLITLCAQHQTANGSDALNALVNFAASKKCHSLSLQIALLSKEWGLSKCMMRSVSRAASSLAKRRAGKSLPESNFDFEMEMPSAIATAAMTSLVVNSRQSANRLFKLLPHRRPSSFDYGERYGVNRVWVPVQSACVSAWSVGRKLSFHHLMPSEVKTGHATRVIKNQSELSAYLDGLFAPINQSKRQNCNGSNRRKLFSHQERNDIANGAACVLRLVNPIEDVLLAGDDLTSDVLTSFLTVWKTELRPGLHWKSQTGQDGIARYVGIGLATFLLRHCERVEKDQAKELIEIINANRFSLGEKIGVFGLIAKRANLADVAGGYAASLSCEIVKDDYIEQRGGSYRELASSLVVMSIAEAREYYAQGLAQLDQMGSDDFDLIYSVLHYAEEQPGGFVQPELSHRLMNLCQTIFQHEASKFGWALFGRAASSSIGFPAIYKLIRWYDQDVADYSYGLPQLACFLAKKGHLDARRAAVLLTICEDHGWYEWQIGDGLRDLLSIADPEDRKSIFLLVTEKLDREHNFGGWEGLWESLLRCMDEFPEIESEDLRSHFQKLRKAARKRREIENARYSSGEFRTEIDVRTNAKQDQKAGEEALAAILAKCDPTSPSSLDEAILSIKKSEALRFDSRSRFFDCIRETCPFENRMKFLEALCEATELEFDKALNIIIECVEAWADSTAHVNKGTLGLIKRLFGFRGSLFFDLRYSGISRQISRLSKLCGDPKFVLQTILETISKERLELGGDEWLQLATSLSRQVDTAVALSAFENLLSSPAAKVGDEIGEGAYRHEFSGKADECDVVADILWHLLGDSDAFVRWNAARSLKGMLDVGLVEDVECLISRFDISEVDSLASEEHNFAALNAQQWLLMGLARAALQHGHKLRPLKHVIESLLKRSDLHTVNKLHLARCLSHINSNDCESAELPELCNEVLQLPHGIVTRDAWPENQDRRIDFDFDYEFNKYEVPALARLFGISDNEAADCIANEVIKRWPAAKDMSDFPGGIRYQRDSRFESYREHIQRHAQLHAATTLAKTKPIVRASYDWDQSNPWVDFLRDQDVSFEDGSWLSDHKDRVPLQAQEYLLSKRKGDQEALVDQGELLRKIGFSETPDDHFMPIHGHWKSPDGVYFRLSSALIREWGAIGHCKNLSRVTDHELWLPYFQSDGRIDRRGKKWPFNPLIWDPENYSIGIDESDELAARGSRARPKLGLNLIKQLGLTPDNDERNWYDRNDKLVLRSEVWGEWRPDPDSHRSRFQDEGAILWADRVWLDEVLSYCKQSVALKLDFSKYKSRRDYDSAPGVRGVYIGLNKSGDPLRFWFARKASQTVY